MGLLSEKFLAQITEGCSIFFRFEKQTPNTPTEIWRRHMWLINNSSLKPSWLCDLRLFDVTLNLSSTIPIEISKFEWLLWWPTKISSQQQSIHNPTSIHDIKTNRKRKAKSTSIQKHISNRNPLERKEVTLQNNCSFHSASNGEIWEKGLQQEQEQ